MTYVLYDGTFQGLLTAVFEIYALKLREARLRKKVYYVKGLFDQDIEVRTESEKAERVQSKLELLLGKKGINNLYRAHLHESDHADDTVYEVIKLALKANVNILSNYNNTHVLDLQDILKKISRERHRMTAFVRFKQGQDGIYYATIEPDFNVVPLIANHFKKRYADQEWVIYDTKRNYGIYYNLEKIMEVELTQDQNNLPSTSIDLTIEEEKFQQLWKDYFKATNIASRKNTKLHLRHVPKRYWKYLIEKQ